MATLFDIIPDNFFSVLSSPNKKIYLDCLFIIYNAIDSIENSFQGEREYVLSKLIDYFEDEGKNYHEDEFEQQTPRQKANNVINIFKDRGWIGEEELGDYKMSINLFDYSIKILDILKSIAQGEVLEYTGEIFTVFSLLNAFDEKEGVGIIEQAYKKTDDIIKKLKSLKANIYRYYYDIMRTKNKDNLHVILEKLLVDYKQNFFDSAYYHLKTTDSLPRYKRAILSQLNVIYNNDALLEKLSEDAMRIKKIADYNDAFHYIESRIRYIKDSFDALDMLIEAIDHKNELYINAAASKILFLTNTSEDLEGLLNRLFKLILSNQLTNYDNIFNLTRIRNLDFESLYTPRRLRQDPVADAIDFDYEMDPDVIQRTISRISKGNVSKADINTHVKNLLNGSDSINASEIKLESTEDFIKLILVFLYSKSIGMYYDVTLLDYQVRIENIKFIEFVIHKKGAIK